MNFGGLLMFAMKTKFGAKRNPREAAVRKVFCLIWTPVCEVKEKPDYSTTIMALLMPLERIWPRAASASATFWNGPTRTR